MEFKGLLEWKILAAIFAVLIVASSAFLGNVDMGGSVFNATGGGLGGWENPFGSLFSQPAAVEGSNVVAIELAVNSISLDFLSPVNITSGDSEIANFAGSAEFDFDSNSSLFTQDGTGVTIRKGIEDTQISGAAVKSIVLESADYTISSGGTNTTATGDRIEIYDFTGTIRAAGKLRLEGTVSSVTNGKWSIS